MPSHLQFMSLDIQLASKQEVLSAIESATPKNTVQIATVNPEFVLEAQNNSEFKKALSGMTHCIIDGSGLFFALQLGRLFKTNKKAELYHGADLAEDLFRRHQYGTKRFFLLGGPEGMAEQASSALKKRYPGIKIVGATDGGDIPRSKVIVDQVLAETITTAKPDILLVAFGAPKQELWMQAAKGLDVPTMIGVGGTFGFYTTKKRAPRAIRALHLESFYRGLTEKGHAKRLFTATVLFPLQAIKWLLFEQSE
jgi:N-acetylglucosaminyldiphosphoundecaprenol N-acetyl-beta-D-mannosaminyltransferase